MTESVPLWQNIEKAKVYALLSSKFKDAALRQKLQNLYLQLSCYPKVPRAPKARQDTGKQSDTLSNDPRDMLDLTVTSSVLGKLLDTSVLIDDVCVFKVGPRIYEVAITRFSYEPCAICLISSNIWTASYTEFRFAWVNSLDQPLEHLPGGPSAKIKNCDESLPLLGL
jgi:2-haloacid dehalogenase